MKASQKYHLSILQILILVAAFALLAGCGSSSKNETGGGGSGTPGYVFITTELGSGILASWPSAGGLAGLEAADNVCQTLATGAVLPGQYIAWMSDFNNDAYCRVQGFSGKKAAKCGETTLPGNAGPWLRMDGFPFAEKIDPVTGVTALVPVLFDETGTETAGIYPTTYWTNTKADGTQVADNMSCGDWTGSTFLAAGGSAFGQAGLWSNSWWVPTGCNNSGSRALLCIKKGPGQSLPNYTSTGLLAFVTSTSQKGNLGGLAGADAICQARADAAGLSTIGTPRTFKAWISTNAVNAIDNFNSDGPWVSLNGLKIADNKADLVDGSLFSAIIQDENGNPGVVRNTYTGTDVDGTATTDTCLDWTSADAGQNATHGQTGWANGRWTVTGLRNCSNNLSLYCLED